MGPPHLGLSASRPVLQIHPSLNCPAYVLLLNNNSLRLESIVQRRWRLVMFNSEEDRTQAALLESAMELWGHFNTGTASDLVSELSKSHSMF